MKSFPIYAVLVCIMIGNSSAFRKVAENPDAIIGIWLVQDSLSKVKIEKENGKFIGKIVWLREPTAKNGKPKVDTKNPDVAMQGRPLLGLQLLTNFVFDSDNVWNDGDIYDPHSGKTYSCKITLKDNNVVEIRGYVGISLFGRTEIWKRCL